MKRGPVSPSSEGAKREKRQNTERELVSTGKVSRGALVECLAKFHDAGLLAEGLSASTKSSLRKEVRAAIEEHSLTDTPYGRVVQS